MSIFLDSSYLIAFVDKRDRAHLEAIGLAEQISEGVFGRIVISDYVFDESVTFIASRQGFKKAIEWGKKTLDSELELIYTSKEVFQKAWELFQKRKNLSFTDCTIVELMKAEGIKHLASFDEGFKQFKEIKLIGN